MLICPELFRLILPCLGLSLCCVEIGLVIMTPSPTPLSAMSQVVCNRNMCIPDNSSDETSTIANVSTAKKPAIKKLIKFCKKKFVLVPPHTISFSPLHFRFECYYNGMCSKAGARSAPFGYTGITHVALLAVRGVPKYSHKYFYC